MEIQLRGLPEGITGKSSVNLQSIDNLLPSLPELNEIKDKLVFDDNCVSGFSACDG